MRLKKQPLRLRNCLSVLLNEVNKVVLKHRGCGGGSTDLIVGEVN